MTNWKVPLADLDIDQEEIDAVSRVLRARWLSMGPVTAEFEQHFAECIGVKYAFAVTNCTAALHLAHLALGAGPGDTIVCPSLTFVATANAIRYTGATPVFADITSENDLNVSPDDIAAKIDATTKGICVMHYGGYACDMDRILQLARQHDLYVVEDAAHAPGAACWMTEANGSAGRPGKVLKKCGDIGDIGCFSFFSNKNMTTGEGGMLTTNDADVAAKIRLLRSHGMTSLTWDREQGHSFSYDVIDLGYNYRIDEIRASIGLVQLSKLEENNRKRSHLVDIYRENFSDIKEIVIPFSESEEHSSHHLFPIILRNKKNRVDFMRFMNSKGIQTSVHYPPIHKFTDYKNIYSKPYLPITEKIENRIVTLPLYSGMNKDQIYYTIESVKEWFIL